MAATGTSLFHSNLYPALRRDSTSSSYGKFISTRISFSTRRLAEQTSTPATKRRPLEAVAAAATYEDLAVGRKSLKEYLERSKELIIRSDGGPPRWFTPLECGPPSTNSPLLLFLPGSCSYTASFLPFFWKFFPPHLAVGPSPTQFNFQLRRISDFSGIIDSGFGLIKQHHGLGKIFEIWCLHTPVMDRTPFTELVKLVERTVRSQNHLSPNRPIYLVGESCGGCLALAVAACNPDIDLVLILANPATSFSHSQLQLFMTLLDIMPDLLPRSLPNMLRLMTGDPLRMMMDSLLEGLSLLQQTVGELSQDLLAISSYLSVLPNVYPRETLGWKLQMLKSALAVSNSRLHAVKAQTLILVRMMGAVPVSGINFYKLFSSKSHVLLYPGGMREALHRKGEEYKLIWPEQSEFVRMAARFGAKIIPFGAVGEDDIGEVVFDYDDLMKIPYFKAEIRELTNETVNLRNNDYGEVANQDVHFPGILPKFPGRFYYYFGKPIITEGRKQELRDREKSHELYMQVKNEVQRCIGYLKERRENDPYRNILSRLIYQTAHGFTAEVPTFEL